jgi:peptide/nickel transport system substrate-binding protein
MRRDSTRWYGRLIAALLAAMLLAPIATTLAQDGTPAASPVGGGEVITSLTREEFTAELEAGIGYTEPEQLGGILVTAQDQDIQGLNPLLGEEAVTNTILDLMYDTLVGSDPRTGQPAPNELADSWEIAADGVTYTFHLNQNATWHDGVPVTAADVVFSMDALASPDSASAYTGAFNDAVASYRAIDDYTVELVANEPLYSFLYEIAIWVVPQHIWGEIPFAEWKTHPITTGQDPAQVIGSGPFRFQEWTPGERVSLVRNDDYFGKVPYIDEYVMQIWPDQTAIVNAFLNNEVDFTALEPADVAAVEGTEGVEIATYDTRNFNYIEYNLNPEMTTLFQDQAVRQALFFAIDREAIVNDLLLGYATVAQGTQPVISYAYAPEEVNITYAYDPDRARALLAEAGWTDTNGDGTVDKDGQEMAFELLYGSGSPTTDQIVAYIQDAWAAIGVGMTPQALEFSALIEATTTDTVWQMAFYGFQWDATFIQDAMFGCDQYKVGFNDMMYCNPELDEIFAQARATFDEAARRELLIEASNIVNEEAPVMVTHFSRGILAYNTRVHNYIPSTWPIPVDYVWLSQ